jgi:hypothetical protein
VPRAHGSNKIISHGPAALPDVKGTRLEALSPGTRSFITELSQRDLNRLRDVVKLIFMKHYPEHHFHDYEADKIIESIGPNVQESMIRAAVDASITRDRDHG